MLVLPPLVLAQRSGARALPVPTSRRYSHYRRHPVPLQCPIPSQQDHQPLKRWKKLQSISPTRNTSALVIISEILVRVLMSSLTKTFLPEVRLHPPINLHEFSRGEHSAANSFFAPTSPCSTNPGAPPCTINYSRNSFNPNVTNAASDRPPIPTSAL